MHALFPDYALRPSTVDPDFKEERDAAMRAAFEVGLYSHEAAVAGDFEKAVRGCPRAEGGGRAAVLRGWMLTDAQYAGLHGALLERGYAPVNSPRAYAEAHYLPLAYPKLEGETPETLYTVGRDVEAAWTSYQRLRDGDVILKDYVKSAKHRWDEACFIPSGTGRARFGEILGTFLAERDRLFEKGFVLRRYVPLVTRGRDMRGYPVAKEARLFFVDGENLLPLAEGFAPPTASMERFRGLAQRFESRFMTMDVAETEAGCWIVIEVGDGGVSGLPPSLVAEDFYDALKARWSGGVEEAR